MMITPSKHKEDFEKHREDFERFCWFDRLTEVHNYRYFRERLKLELENARRHRTPISLLFVDIDRFKNFNDKFGHYDGDKLLKQLTKLLTDNISVPGGIARCGGDEFAILLPETNKYEAVAYAEKIRIAIEQTKFQTSTGKTAQITVSIGVAAYPVDADDEENLTMKADIALRQAKQRGRNRTVAYKQI